MFYFCFKIFSQNSENISKKYPQILDISEIEKFGYLMGWKVLQSDKRCETNQIFKRLEFIIIKQIHLTMFIRNTQDYILDKKKIKSIIVS